MAYEELLSLGELETDPSIIGFCVPLAQTIRHIIPGYWTGLERLWGKVYPINPVKGYLNTPEHT
jgi:hypothetical protein